MSLTRIQNSAQLARDLGVTPAQLIGIQNAFTQGNPAGLNGAMGFDINVFEQVTARAYDVKLPDILWSQTIDPSSIDTSINPGAKLASYRVRDRRGKGSRRPKRS